MSKTDNHNKMYINAKGERVMRVTEVLKILAKDQLIYWANALGFQGVTCKKELERTSNIGTMVHAIAEDYKNPKALPVIDFDLYEIYDYRSQVEATNALKSIFAWFDANPWFTVVFQEKVVVGEHLGGTMDVGAQGIKNPDHIILADYKTSPDFYLSQFLQLAGYTEIYEEVHGPEVEGVMVILADKKHGKMAKTMFIPRENLTPFIICFDCLYSSAVAHKQLMSCWQQLSEEVP